MNIYVYTYIPSVRYGPLEKVDNTVIDNMLGSRAESQSFLLPKLLVRLNYILKVAPIQIGKHGFIERQSAWQTLDHYRRS